LNPDVETLKGRVNGLYQEAVHLASQHKVPIIITLALLLSIALLWFFSDEISAFCKNALAFFRGKFSPEAKPEVKAIEEPKVIALKHPSGQTWVNKQFALLKGKVIQLAKNVPVPVAEGKGKQTTMRGNKFKVISLHQKKGSKKTRWAYDIENSCFVELSEDDYAIFMDTGRFVSEDQYRSYMIEHADEYDLTQEQLEALYDRDAPIERYLGQRYKEDREVVEDVDYDEAENPYDFYKETLRSRDHFVHHSEEDYDEVRQNNQAASDAYEFQGGSSNGAYKTPTLEGKPSKNSVRKAKALAKAVAQPPPIPSPSPAAKGKAKAPPVAEGVLIDMNDGTSVYIDSDHSQPPVKPAALAPKKEGKSEWVPREPAGAPSNWKKLTDQDKKRFLGLLSQGKVKQPYVDRNGKPRAWAVKVPIAWVAQTPVAENKGSSTPTNLKWMKSVRAFGNENITSVVVATGNYILATSHVVADLNRLNELALFPTLTWHSLGGDRVKTTGGEEGLYAAERPQTWGMPSMPLGVFDPTLERASFLLNAKGQLASGIVKESKNGRLTHSMTTEAGDCNSPVVVLGRVVGLHIAGGQNGENYALAIQPAHLEALADLKNRPKNADPGVHLSAGGALPGSSQ